MLIESKRGKRLKIRHIAAFFFGWLFLAGLGVAGGGVIYLAVLIKQLPSPNDLNNRNVVQSTKIYDRDGKVLLYEIHGEEKRTVVPFENIPQNLKNATLAAEDAEFYTEPAFSWKAILRALASNLRAGKVTQGGSTISQQLAKNIFLSSERTVTRKIKELVLALELEANYSKDQIFSFYLNQIPYGSNAYGIEAASQTFFGKPVSSTTLAEAAALASLPKAPSYYSPWGNNIKLLLERKDKTLDRMEELHWITPKERDQAKKEILVFMPPSLGSIKAPHFVLSVKDYLINKYGEELVTNGGLRVLTTLDWDLQQQAEKSVEEGVKRNLELYNAKNSALVAQDSKTGQVLALVGSRNYFDIANDGNFNIATQGLRQPGSALKPFVYMTAFQKEYSPKTVLWDVPTEFDARNDNDPEHSYSPKNFDDVFIGPVTMENALAQSRNVPAVKALYLAGFDDVLKNLHSFGITTLKERWRYGLSLTLGGGEVRLIDLVNAYATLSQEGVRHTQTLVLRIEDASGRVLEEYRDSNESVMDPQYPRMISQILSDAQLRSPVFQASLPLTVFPDYEVALKTGTTEDYRDAWALGYTPFLTVGVWAGNNNNTPMTHKGTSILAAVPIWNSFLKEVLKKFPPESFTKPESYVLPQKPMLNGESEIIPVLNGKRFPQIHSILFYTDKNDPLGPVPQNPLADPQYENWERGVLEWARINLPSFSSYNQPVPEGATFYYPSQKIPVAPSLPPPVMPGSSLSMENLMPKSGEFMNTPFRITANFNSSVGLKKIELYYNRRLISSLSVFGIRYYYSYLFDLPLETQNLFEIRASDVNGKEIKSSFVVNH
ncbi:MAG: PBP1A family penicillin-binding protein [Patescibacteria group bacterium]